MKIENRNLYYKTILEKIFSNNLDDKLILLFNNDFQKIIIDNNMY